MTEAYYGAAQHQDSIDGDDDAPMVAWVDEQLAAAENSGNLLALELHVNPYASVQAEELASVFAQAWSDDDVDPDPQSDEPAPPPRTRDEIRELIFAKLRRPDGAPYAAGYTHRPAARNARNQDEDTRLGQRFDPNDPRANTDDWVTDYESRETLDQRAAQPDPSTDNVLRGRVLDADGQPINGRWGWVVDEETGYLLLFDEAHVEVTSPGGVTSVAKGGEHWAKFAAGYTVTATHHTTPVAGMPVRGAGMMQLLNGVIKEITDESRHYRPDAAQQFDALQGIGQDGFALDQASVRMTGSQQRARPTGKAGWINEAAAENPLFPRGDVSLPYQQFKETSGDEYQIRSKMAVNDQIRQGKQAAITTEGVGTAEPDYFGAYQPPDPNDTFSIMDDTFDTPSSFSTDFADSSEDSSDESSEEDWSEDESNEGPDLDANGYPITQPRPAAATPGSAYTEDDTDAAFVIQGRDYLTAAGRSGFAEWFRTLSKEHQDLLLTDASIAAAWRTEPAPAAPAWMPNDNDQRAAATVNSAFVDSLHDRQGAAFTLAGFMLLIGDGHNVMHQAYVDDAGDSVTGTVTVRKAAIGRGAGTLTFIGVPPAKHEIVRASVTRFSSKQVRFV